MSYYRMERGWQDSPMFKDAPYDDRAAWAWMVGEARWNSGHVPNHVGTPIHLKRGQFMTSIRFMADKFKWSKDRVTRFVKRLTKWRSVVTETASGQIVVTICNYEEYQADKDNLKDSNKDTPKDTPKDDPKDKQEENQNNQERQKRVPDAAVRNDDAGIDANGRPTRAMVIEFPEWLMEDGEAQRKLQEFVAMRARIKRPIVTQYQFNRLLGQLTRLHNEGHDASAVIQQSVERAWEGFYELKAEGPKKSYSHRMMEATAAGVLAARQKMGGDHDGAG